jgi:iron-sulfur cluster repair protein YtfE (RIC family)
MKLTKFGALAELISQHDALRRRMDTCERLADELDVGGVEPETLMSELALLRHAFETHNAYEESILRPVLLAEDTHGATRIERMMEDHIHEHREIGRRLGTPATAELRDVIDTLRAHLDAEERYLLSSKVLRDNRLPAT